MENSRLRNSRLLVALAVVLEAVFVVVAWRPNAANFPLPRTLLWLSAAGIFYLIAVAVTLRAHTGSGLRLRWIVLAAVVFRLTLLPLTPQSAAQAQRYRWDGKIQQAGFNPYAYPPASDMFSPVRAPEDAAVPNPQVAATAPPLAELLFRWNFGWSSGLRTGKILWVVCDLLLIGLLIRMLRRRALPLEWVLLYAWSPLAVYEVAGNGHLAPAATLLLLAALHGVEKRPRWAAAAAVAAGMTQWFAWTLAPVVVVAARRRWRSVLAAGVAAAVLFSLPFWFFSTRFMLPALAGNVRSYLAAAPIYNASLYALVHAWFGAHAGVVLAVALTLAAIVSACVRRLPPLRAGFVIISTLLLVLPQVHPWFALWLLPLVVFYPQAPWLYFSVAVLWAYLVGTHPWGVLIEYAPLYALLAWQAWQRPRAAKQPA
ncbi:MAG TPA: glycosyltransferase 87 family protein [Terriglobales bacterium]|nr:glycosyltransferase 87 family protein [Terriglobales bacterium]